MYTVAANAVKAAHPRNQAPKAALNQAVKAEASLALRAVLKEDLQFLRANHLLVIPD
jgi:hypothetical protein